MNPNAGDANHLLSEYYTICKTIEDNELAILLARAHLKDAEQKRERLLKHKQKVDVAIQDGRRNNPVF